MSLFYDEVVDTMVMPIDITGLLFEVSVTLEPSKLKRWLLNAKASTTSAYTYLHRDSWFRVNKSQGVCGELDNRLKPVFECVLHKWLWEHWGVPSTEVIGSVKP